MATGGSVVLVSTVAAQIGLVNHEAIAAAKGAVNGLVLSAAASYAGRGHPRERRRPGAGAHAAGREDHRRTRLALKASTAMHPLGRIGEPDDVAAAVAWLLDPATSGSPGRSSASTAACRKSAASDARIHSPVGQPDRSRHHGLASSCSCRSSTTRCSTPGTARGFVEIERRHTAADDVRRRPADARGTAGRFGARVRAAVAALRGSAWRGAPAWWAGVTAFVSVPLHEKLAAGGYDADTHRRLVRTNWLRVFAWWLHFGVCGVMVVG